MTDQNVIQIEEKDKEISKKESPIITIGEGKDIISTASTSINFEKNRYTVVYKIKLPSVLFENTQIPNEIKYLRLKIMKTELKIKLPNVFYFKTDISNELHTIKFSKKFRKIIYKLPLVEKFPYKISNIIAPIKFVYKLKKRVYILPNVVFESDKYTSILQPLRISWKSANDYISAEGKQVNSISTNRVLDNSIIYKAEISDIFLEDSHYEEDWEVYSITNFGQISENLSRDPIIIIINEESAAKEFIKDVLKRIIEEYEGEFYGFEEITIKNCKNKKEDEKDEAEREREEHIRRFLNVHKKVIVVNTESISSLLQCIDVTSLSDRLNELKGTGMGFLIFYVKESTQDDIKKLRKIMSSKSIRTIYVESSSSDFLINLLKELFYLDEKYVDKIREKVNKQELGYEEKDFYEVLRRWIINRQRRLVNFLSLIVKRNSGEESDLHYALKCLTVYYLAKRRGLIKSKINLQTLMQIQSIIRTEEVFNNGKVVDVYYDNEIWEIETLLGEGKRGGMPLTKIVETVEKIANFQNIHTINIVIDNLTYFIHKRELKNMINFLREKYKKEIFLWTANWLLFELIKI